MDCDEELTEAQAELPTCPHCQAALNCKRSVSFTVAELPPIFGSTIE